MPFELPSAYLRNRSFSSSLPWKTNQPLFCWPSWINTAFYLVKPPGTGNVWSGTIDHPITWFIIILQLSSISFLFLRRSKFMNCSRGIIGSNCNCRRKYNSILFSRVMSIQAEHSHIYSSAYSSSQCKVLYYCPCHWHPKKEFVFPSPCLTPSSFILWMLELIFPFQLLIPAKNLSVTAFETFSLSSLSTLYVGTFPASQPACSLPRTPACLGQ